jgi:hypothetical protein
MTGPVTRRTLLALSTVLVACGACGGSDATTTSSTPPADTTPDAPPASTATPDAPPATPPVGSTPAKPPAPPAAPTPPSGLTCLAGHYVGTPVSTAKGWVLRLPDNTDLVWDDGTTKTYDFALDNPDLEDTLEMPYTLGPITPNNTLDKDPGRIRQDALLKATFGATAAAVQANLVNVDFVGQTVQFASKGAAALGKVSTKLKALVAATPSLGAYVTGELGGTFNWRPIAQTNRLSPHSYGIAIDIVVSKSAYWEWDTPMAWKNQIPQAIVDAFESEGFAWGGRWYHYDTMHFEYRPELFDPACTAH